METQAGPEVMLLLTKRSENYKDKYTNCFCSQSTAMALVVMEVLKKYENQMTLKDQVPGAELLGGKQHTTFYILQALRNNIISSDI
ncbi:hypothetical protein Y1Q_0011834 [Alligator mississippiensis]|uniref:Uncharacterized protein n=1 Tax=Alligator mississippiensis TaxID=8496 RepID=A0A151LYJ2_ALLMI|nr:hypothetical protein Y1Q_0011834 [Alligator mississippiensis]